MVVPLAVGLALKGTAVVAAALAVAGAFLLGSPRARAVGLLAALALTPVLLLGELWNAAEIEDIRARPGVAAAIAAVGVAAVGCLAAVLRRSPWLLPPLALAALPFRLPVEVGGTTANLLVPLYLVIGAGAIAYAWPRVAARDDAPPERPAGPLELALLVAIVAYALQSVYSTDFEQALKNIAFFYVPFALLLRLLGAVDWSRRVVLACFGLGVGLALLFCAVGFYEYATRQLLWNPKVIAANQFQPYFRVNSLFFDPNIFGRFIATVMLFLAAAALWARTRERLLLACLGLAILWAGLVLTFSQSSFGALLVGLAVLGALRWSVRPVAAAAGVAAGVALVVVIAFPGALNLDLSSERALDRASSGRIELMRGGLSMFADRPLSGFGSGSFSERFKEREEATSQEAEAASHTTPITIAAEQGFPGLTSYALVLVALALTLLSGLRAVRSPSAPPPLVARAGVAAASAALVFHTLVYSAFLEDPLTWVLAAAALALGFRGGEASPAEPSEQPAGVPGA